MKMAMFKFNCAMIRALCLSSIARIVKSAYIFLSINISQFIYKISLQLIKDVTILTETRKSINLYGSWINLLERET